MIEWDDRELRGLAVDLGNLTRASQKAVNAVMGAGADALGRQWRSNARKTAGAHARFYPNSITAEQRFSTAVVFEVGPDISKKQGKLGRILEFGSATSPPHLDGQRAADKVLPQLETDIANALAGVTASPKPDKAPLVEYTTKAGVTRMATEAQVAAWTRSRR